MPFRRCIRGTLALSAVPAPNWGVCRCARASRSRASGQKATRRGLPGVLDAQSGCDGAVCPSGKNDRRPHPRRRPPGPTARRGPPGPTPSPPDVIPQHIRRAARAPGATARPERRHPHARSRVTVAAARTPDSTLARLVMLAGVIWRSLVGQPEDGRRDRLLRADRGARSAGMCRRRRRIRGWFVADDDRGGITVQALGSTPHPPPPPTALAACCAPHQGHPHQGHAH